MRSGGHSYPRISTYLKKRQRFKLDLSLRIRRYLFLSKLLKETIESAKADEREGVDIKLQAEISSSSGDPERKEKHVHSEDGPQPNGSGGRVNEKHTEIRGKDPSSAIFGHPPNLHPSLSSISWVVVISDACQKSGLVDLGGLRGPESRRNACQEVYSIDNNQGKDRDNDKQPAGGVKLMQTFTERNGFEPVPKTGAEQTIRLMGKNLTVGKGNKQDQGCARTTTINLTFFF